MLSIKIANVVPNHYVYPAIIEQTDENYCLYFPDLPGCFPAVIPLENRNICGSWSMTMRKFQQPARQKMCKLMNVQAVL